MARSGPRKINRYTGQFKATAVKLSSLPGVLIQDVAGALDIQPFMLSLWNSTVAQTGSRRGDRGQGCETRRTDGSGA